VASLTCVTVICSSLPFMIFNKTHSRCHDCTEPHPNWLNSRTDSWLQGEISNRKLVQPLRQIWYAGDVPNESCDKVQKTGALESGPNMQPRPKGVRARMRAVGQWRNMGIACAMGSNTNAAKWFKPRHYSGHFLRSRRLERGMHKDLRMPVLLAACAQYSRGDEIAALRVSAANGGLQTTRG
jgi:hypothetical protein